MKFIFILLTIFSFSTTANVNVNQCLGNKGDIGIAMRITMGDDLDVDKSSIVRENTSFKIIRNEPITHALAKTFGIKEWIMSGGDDSEDRTTPDGYAEGFMEDNARNFIVEYTFENREKKHNVFLASVFYSDVACIVRFNGYIIVKREF